MVIDEAHRSGAYKRIASTVTNGCLDARLAVDVLAYDSGDVGINKPGYYPFRAAAKFEIFVD